MLSGVRPDLHLKLIFCSWWSLHTNSLIVASPLVFWPIRRKWIKTCVWRKCRLSSAWLLHLPQVRDYWSTSEILATPCIWFPSVMPQDRFFLILRCLHLVDTTQQKKKGDVVYYIQGAAIDQPSRCCILKVLQTWPSYLHWGDEFG